MTGVVTEASPRKAGWTFRMVCITAVSYLIIPAMVHSLVSLNAPSEIIREFINETEMLRTGHPFSESSIDSLYGLLVAVFGIGAGFGSMTAASISDLVGRKLALFIACITGSIGTLIMVLSAVAGSYEMLFVGRIISGVALGWGFSIAPTYIMDMCLPHQKGAAAMASIISQSLAILMCQIFGYQELLGNKDNWLYLIGLPLVLLTLELILLPFCPNNPRYLIMKRNDEAGAIKVLRLIHGREDVTEDIKQIHLEVEESSTKTQISICKLFVTPAMRRPLLIVIVMSLHQSWSGLNGIILFSGALFRDVGVPDRSSRYASSGTGAIFLLSNFAGAFLMQHFGRKTLFVAGIGSMSTCTAFFALTVIFQEQADFLKYLNIVMALLIVASFASGPMTVFWVMLSELFPNSARGAAFGVAILCIFSAFFTHCFGLPIMIQTMSAYTFFVYAGINTSMTIFCIFCMPETRNRTFEEISKNWTKSVNTGNSLPSSTNIPLSVLSNIETDNQANGFHLSSNGK